MTVSAPVANSAGVSVAASTGVKGSEKAEMEKTRAIALDRALDRLEVSRRNTTVKELQKGLKVNVKDLGISAAAVWAWSVLPVPPALKVGGRVLSVLGVGFFSGQIVRKVIQLLALKSNK